MFLSMVDSPAERPLAMRPPDDAGEVLDAAASRARPDSATGEALHE